MHRSLSDQSASVRPPASRQPASFSHNNPHAEITATDILTQSLESDHLEDYTDSINLSGPFQLLLVSRRFSDAAIQSLWKGLVFHGHDPFQIQTLLATLNKEDGVFEDMFEPSKHQFSVLQRLKEEVSEDENEISDKVDSQMSMQGCLQEEYRITNLAPTAGFWLESLNRSMKRFQGCLLRRKDGVEADPVAEVDRGVNPTLPPEQQNNADQNWTQAETKPGHRRNCYRRHSASGLESSFGVPFYHSSAPTSLPEGNQPRWSYRRFVKRVVLNFAHPQASPHLLVQVLETLGSRCKNQIQELDLHANEKMRAQGSGLETSTDLERLFGSGFKNLKCLRLQGGFLDNQLLSAIIKGLTSPISATSSPMSSMYAQGRPLITARYPPSARLKSSSFTAQTPPCRLSQVFLGPGSITDSAIEKLIAAAGQTLEVFTVTSCVDVGGGALASLLTKCPSLRVLGVYRSLARDTELLEGLGLTLTSEGQVAVDDQGDSSTDVHATTQAVNTGSAQEQVNTQEPSLKARSKIIAPLERLELGTVKLTTVSIAEVLKGTCPTLRFLVLETRHFKEEFLRDVIVPLCQKLEGLYFDDLEYLQRVQQRAVPRAPTVNTNTGDAINVSEEIHMIATLQQQQQQQQQQRGPVVANRFFQFGRSRRNIYTESIQRISRPWSQGNTNNNIHAANMSPWLGETSTREWITLGDCALWASAPASVAVCSDSNVNGINNRGVATSLNRNMAASTGNFLHHRHGFYQAHTTQSYTHGSAEGDGSETEGRGEGRFYSMASFDGDYRTVLEGFNMDLSAIDLVTQSLRRLQKFEVMQLVLVTDKARLNRESGGTVGKSSEELQGLAALKHALVAATMGLVIVLLCSTFILDSFRS
ncbi:hypothetical protein BGZ92_007859 [Podila epicladia]|nr:hypothetical protein BGZ92_007859 [Podila epicladia]